MWPYWPEMRWTGSSKLATSRRWRPKTSKNSFQKVCFSAASLRVPAQLWENWMARWRISFHESGMGEFYSDCGRLSVGISLNPASRTCLLGLSPVPPDALLPFQASRQDAQLVQILVEFGGVAEHPERASPE